MVTMFDISLSSWLPCHLTIKIKIILWQNTPLFSPGMFKISLTKKEEKKQHKKYFIFLIIWGILFFYGEFMT